MWLERRPIRSPALPFALPIRRSRSRAAGSLSGIPRRFLRDDPFEASFERGSVRSSPFPLSPSSAVTEPRRRGFALRCPVLTAAIRPCKRARVLRARRSRYQEPSRGGRFRRAAHPWPARSTLAGRGHARRKRAAATGSTRPPLGGSAPSRRLCRSRRRREGAKNLRPAEMVASFGSDPRPPWPCRALPARVEAIHNTADSVRIPKRWLCSQPE